MSAVAPVDVASRFLETARRRGGATALKLPRSSHTFAELADAVERMAAGLRRAGLKPGERVALLVPPSFDFFVCTFALFRAGQVPVLIDPGIGFANMGRCLEEAEPAAFLGSPKAHVARLLGRWARSSRLNVVADGRLPGLLGTRDLLAMGARGGFDAPAPEAEATAAILFTSGSTGAPKGAVYTHGMFAAQVDLLRSLFKIREGDAAVATFPLFALFDAALGQTAVIPDMDFTRPGFVAPDDVLEPLKAADARQLFGSPALLDAVGRDAAARGLKLPSLRRVLSAGAPVHVKVLRRFAGLLAPDVEVFTPYGATEALPVALIGSQEVLGETAAMTEQGRGICVGRPVEGVDVRIIGIQDGPIPEWSDALLAGPGAVGEIVVKGPVVSRSYFRRPDGDALAKIRDGSQVRHRMGDLGYFDEQGRLWFCGRKAHRVATSGGELYTVQVEGVFNAHSAVKRTALVGARGRPVLCVEREPGARLGEAELTRELLALGARFPHTAKVTTVLYHPAFPVDIRHNAKIFREKLAVWAAGRVKA